MLSDLVEKSDVGGCLSLSHSSEGWLTIMRSAIKQDDCNQSEDECRTRGDRFCLRAFLDLTRKKQP